MIRAVSLPEFELVDESVQPSGSFKWRGVRCQIRGLLSSRRVGSVSGIVTFSSGNHGMAVALAARQLRLRCLVVLPEWAHRAKVTAVERYGATAVVEGHAALECELAALALASRTGYRMVHPFRSVRQITGYATLWTELALGYPMGADVVVPVGSGGLLASGLLAANALQLPFRFIGAEPRGGDSVRRALIEGRPTVVGGRSKVAPGLGVEVLAEELLPLMEDCEELILRTVSDDEIVVASESMMRFGLSVDTEAAAAIAILSEVPPGPRPLIVVGTGGKWVGRMASVRRVRTWSQSDAMDRRVEDACASYWERLTHTRGQWSSTVHRPPPAAPDPARRTNSAISEFPELVPYILALPRLDARHGLG